MDYGIFIVLFELEVFLLEMFKVVIEVKAGEVVSKLALRLFRFMTLFNFLLVNFIIGSI
jgi:hypothetical protein